MTLTPAVVHGITTTEVHLVSDREAVEYRRPKWMSAEQWQDASVELTERWLTLLDEAARGSALCACGKPASHLGAPADEPDWACRVPRTAPCKS